MAREKERFRTGWASCISSFDCANLKNLDYPFWGSERPDYCGHPKFELDCDGEYAEITIKSESYRVLEVNYSDYSLRVVRTDFWDDVCLTYFRNNSIDLPFFNYSLDSRNLTLYYDCLSSPFSDPYITPTQFNCSKNSTKIVDYFLLAGGGYGTSEIEQTGACRSTVIVPILGSQARILDEDSSVENMKTAIHKGFKFAWEANNTLCSACRNSGGQCGYNISSSEFTCYCKDGPVPSECKSSKYQCSSNSYQYMQGTDTQ
ncbi:LEAF RUST 10 DISEASE-RESISTANCE LOCUS RECEPTOR-LIKE PROTEIN KINASE-like 2.7 [Neltuma alba]|uniref:LEAF RUST 10 DISEASE-RESISTANCE LOCUS RECEPTOR-LIKE PROTEIN KINASE-like 2.7 n=1 Tax=Neltuma alba TaxID=207710 RepID=UPI0010A4406E|nr:LEAF RUST 10 DISEASE-RESISTANCE LOCUS RECEPTOR-LIKE PROTEIN KINASE-like 2.7 [Prosopis alba]